MSARNRQLVYIGTYTHEGDSARSEGLYSYYLDPATGHLTALEAISGAVNPSFLTISHDHRILYCVNETGQFEGYEGGGCSSYAIVPLDEPDGGRLTFLNAQPTHGADPCYVSLDASGQWVYIANYTGGSLTVLPHLPGGQLRAPNQVIRHRGASMNHKQQDAAHVHCTLPDLTGRFVLVADLGIDKIVTYQIVDEDRPLTRVQEVSTAPGAGPRHLVFHPDGKFVYCANELDATVTVYAYDEIRGMLRPIQTLSTLPEPVRGNAVADIHILGKFLYVSNRGHNSIAIYVINTDSADHLSPVQFVSTEGKWPRNFAFSPDGRWLLVANQHTNNVVVFSVDQATGGLTPTGEQVSVHAPVCVQIIAE